MVTGAGDGADASAPDVLSPGDEESPAVEPESGNDGAPAAEAESLDEGAPGVDVDSLDEGSPAVVAELEDDDPVPELDRPPAADAVALGEGPDDVDTAAGLAARCAAAASAGSWPEESCTKIVAHKAMKSATVSATALRRMRRMRPWRT